MTPHLHDALAPKGPGVSTALLALDLGTSCGWAVRNGDGAICSGTIDLKPSRWDGGGMRYLRLRRWLVEAHAAAGGFERVVFEEVRRHLGVDAAHIYGGLVATLTAWGEANSIPYGSVPIGTWKNALGLKGNAGKPAVLAAVKALGHSPDSEDEADALGILLCAVAAR